MESIYLATVQQYGGRPTMTRAGVDSPIMLACAGLAIALAAPVQGAGKDIGASASTGEVAGEATVIDGMTLEIAGQRFRLYGIDAPDLDQKCTTGNGDSYYCGRASRAGLVDITVGSTVTCRRADTGTDYVPLGRCSAAEFDLSRGMVHSGWALADRSRTQVYVDVEYDARTNKRGLWKGAFVPPWEWRKGIRDPKDRPKSKILQEGLPGFPK